MAGILSLISIHAHLIRLVRLQSVIDITSDGALEDTLLA